MLKKVMAALFATVAFMPAARAQDAEPDDGRAPTMSRRAEINQMIQRADAQRGEAPRRFEQAQRREDAAPPMQRAPDQPRPAPQARDDGARRGGEGRGDMFAERARRQQAEAQVQVQPPRQRDGDRPRGNQQGGWRGNDAGRSAPVVIDQRRSDEARRDDGNRQDRRFDDQRRVDDQRRFDDRRRADAARRNDGNRGWNDRDRNRADDRRASNNWSVGNWSNNNWSNNGWNGRGDWNRRWRDDNRYDWGRYRQQNRNLFRLPRYYAPYDWNYGYRRFSIGVTLSSLLWDQDYWIEDPDYYRLPPAYGPYRWVRYYNDALLVDIRSGYVVDTVYDIFW